MIKIFVITCILKSLGKTSKEFAASVKELELVASLLEAMGYPFEIYPGIHKDLTYYTGVMFDVYVNDVNVGGGGRYDRLLEKFTGKQIGGSGFSVFVEPLMELMKEREEKPPIPVVVSLVTNLENRDDTLEAFRLAGLLRRRGAAVEILAKKERSKACNFMGEIKKTKSGYTLAARAGRIKETFSLPLESVKDLLTFWGF